MRATVGDVVRQPKWLASWWEELPARRWHWWHEVLFEPGQGWLRWGWDRRERIYYDPPDMDQWQVAPPLRRVWLWVAAYITAPWHMLRHGCSFCQVVCSWSDMQTWTDDDRKRLFR